VSVAQQKLLCVSVNCDEFNATQTNLDHAIDGVNATATDADDLDYCEWILAESHLLPPLLEKLFGCRQTLNLLLRLTV
jgi:hypothetical protein